MDSHLQVPKKIPKSSSLPDFHGITRMRHFNMEMKRGMSPRLPKWIPPEKFQQSTGDSNQSLRKGEITFFATNIAKTDIGKYLGDHDNREEVNDNDENLSFIDLYGEEGISKAIECDKDISDSDDGIENSINYQSSHNSQLRLKSAFSTRSDLFTGSSIVESSTFNSCNSYLSLVPKISVDDNGIYDQYGFKKYTKWVPEITYDRWWNKYSTYCKRRKAKWRLYLGKHKIQSQMDQSIPKKFPERSEKLKRYIRKGIPSDWRGNAWWYFAKGDDLLKMNIGKYKSLVYEMEQIIDLSQNDRDKRSDLNKVYLDMEIIERDLYRTFPNNIYFQKDENSNDGEPEIISALRRVLVAFSIYNPKIGYCQSMNFLAGLLLLFLEEEKVFWMLVIITSKYLPGVHDVSLEGVNIDQGVLMLCVKEYLPEIWKIIESTCEMVPTLNDQHHSKNGRFENDFIFKLPPITLCTVSWFMSCFIGVVPIEVTLRIWDCLFYEGSHFLFKMSLAILKICENEMLHNKSQRRIPGISATGLGIYSKFNNDKNNGGNGFRINSRGNDSDIMLFQLVQSLPKTLLDPNDLFERSIFKRTAKFNDLEQSMIDNCRNYVMDHRRKYKDYVNLMNEQQGNDTKRKSVGKTSIIESNMENTSNDNIDKDSSKNNIAMTAENLSDVLMNENYEFRKTSTNFRWNNLISKGGARKKHKGNGP